MSVWDDLKTADVNKLSLTETAQLLVDNTWTHESTWISRALIISVLLIFFFLLSLQINSWTWPQWTWKSLKWRTWRRSWRSGASRARAALKSPTSSAKSQSWCPSTRRQPPTHGQTCKNINIWTLIRLQSSAEKAEREFCWACLFCFFNIWRGSFRSIDVSVVLICTSKWGRASSSCS